MDNSIGIIGFGNMGSAIAGRIKDKYRVFVFEKDKHRTEGLKGVTVCANISDLASAAEVLLIAVKPQDFGHLLKEIKSYSKDKLIISIAAGISTNYIEKALGNVRVVRAMPNIGAKIGESVTCVSKGMFAGEHDLDFARELFYLLGEVKEIEEKMMNAATAISGSGPAYIFYFVEKNGLDPDNIPEHSREDFRMRLERAAIELGFAFEYAAFLSSSTVNTGIALMKETRLAPSELRQQVSSKGGTTEAAIRVLEQGGSWDEAAKAALKRAEELSKKE